MRCLTVVFFIVFFLVLVSSAYATDTTAPTITLLTPEDGTTYRLPRENFSYRVVDSSKIDWCKLVIGNSEAAHNPTPVNNSVNYFRNVSVTNGNWSWYVNCIDEPGNSRNTSAWTLNVNIDNVSPSVYVNSSMAVQVDTRNVTFSYLPNESETSIYSCKLLINGNVYATDTTISNEAYNSFTNVQLSEGYWLWQVNCTDILGNSDTSEILLTQVFAVIETPTITLDSPTNNTIDTDGVVTYKYTPSSGGNNSDITWCSLFLNDSVLDSSTNVTEGVQNSFSTYTMSNGIWRWRVRCRNSLGFYGNSSTFVLNVSTTGVLQSSYITVVANSPSDGSTDTDGRITFSYTPTADATLERCNLITNRSIRSYTTSPTSGTANLFSNVELSPGSWKWKIECRDILGNTRTTIERTIHVSLKTFEDVGGKPQISQDLPLIETTAPKITDDFKEEGITEVINETASGEATGTGSVLMLLFAALGIGSFVAYIITNEKYWAKVKGLVKKDKGPKVELDFERKEQLLSYIIKSMRAGYPKDTIYNHLKKYKWSDKHINEAFKEVERYIKERRRGLRREENKSEV